MKIVHLPQNTPYTLSLFVLAGVFLVMSGTAYGATTYYVSKTGNDGNSCSQAQTGPNSQAKKTIRAGASCLGSGDTLIVGAGTYVESLINVIPGGSSWNTATTVKADQGATVTIRGVAGDYPVLLFSGVNTKYIVVNGFIIDAIDVTYQALKIAGSTGNQAHHIRIQNSEVKNAKATGILTAPGSNGNQFINLNTHHHGYGLFQGGVTQVQYNYAFYLNGSNNLIEGCRIWNQGSWGIHIYNGFDGNSNNNVIRNNRVYGNGVKKNSGGIIIGAGSGNIVYNNLVYNNTGKGIQLSRKAKAFNNTIYNNNGIAIQLAYSGGSSEVRNNIIWQNGTNAVLNQGTGTSILSNNLMSNPSFVDANGFDLNIKSSSQAIDSGYNLNSYFDFDIVGISSKRDSNFDIGAYEFKGGSGNPQNLPPDAPTNLRVATSN